MSNFQVGRRVRLRGTKDKGRIVTIFDDDPDEMVVRFDSYIHDTTVLVESLKLLKPRTPKAAARAREFYIYPKEGENDRAFKATVYTEWSGTGKVFHVREILEGEVCLSRETFSKAWNEMSKISDYVSPPHASIAFENLCNVLGLKEGTES